MFNHWSERCHFHRLAVQSLDSVVSFAQTGDVQPLEREVSFPQTGDVQPLDKVVSFPQTGVRPHVRTVTFLLILDVQPLWW